MNRNQAFILLMLIVMVVGCTSTRRDAASLRVPTKLELGVPGSPAGPVRIRSGRMVQLGLFCPPVELRDADGKVLRKLDWTRQCTPIGYCSKPLTQTTESSHSRAS